MAANNHRPAPVVAVVNMKGGVGKTTVSANLFREVCLDFKKRTLLIDCDPQYNLSQMLLSEHTYDGLVESGRTLWRVMAPPDPISIFDVSEDDLVRLDTFDTYSSRRLNRSSDSSQLFLDLIPGDFRLAKLNLIEEAASLRIARRRFTAFVEDAKAHYDLIVIDCNPSSSFLTRTAIEVASHLLIPFKADRFSMLGLDMISEYIKMIPTMRQTPERIIVVNDVTTQATAQQFIRRVRRHDEYGRLTLANVVQHSDVMRYPPTYAGFAAERPVSNHENVRRMFSKVASDFGKRMGF